MDRPLDRNGPVIPDDVLTAHLEGEAVLLHMDTKRYYRLNDTAQRIWTLLEGGRTRDEAAAVLAAEYDVERTDARAGIDRLIGKLRAHRLVATEEVGEDGAP